MSEETRGAAAPGDWSADGTTPAQRPVVYLHIGAPKTGTTFLQRVMWQNRARLAELGTLYPGATFGAHVQAAFDLREAGFRGYRDPKVPGSWPALVDEARAWGGPVIISQELLSPATVAQVDRALDDLAFAEVHLIYTARELTRQVPAAWQEDIKNRFTIGFDEYVAGLRDPDQDTNGLGRMFWRMQDAAGVLQRWARHIPAGRVHIVTVPQRGGPPDLLWRRFAGVVGVDPGAVDVSDGFLNTSLGVAEASFLLRLNRALDAEIGWPLYNQLVKHHLAQEVLSRREPVVRLELPAASAPWFIDRGTRMVEELQARRYDVVGTLDDLVPPSTDTLPQDVPESSVEEQLEIAIEATAALLLQIARLRRKAVPA